MFELTEKVAALLKKHGFKWLKNASTDTVDPLGIKAIYPAAGGFTVEYTPDSVLRYSTAKVKSIDVPDDPAKTWIMVEWLDIADDRK